MISHKIENISWYSVPFPKTHQDGRGAGAYFRNFEISFHISLASQELHFYTNWYKKGLILQLTK